MAEERNPFLRARPSPRYQPRQSPYKREADYDTTHTHRKPILGCTVLPAATTEILSPNGGRFVKRAPVGKVCPQLGRFVPSHHPLAPYADALYIAPMFASESYRNCLETERLLMKDIRKDTLPARERAICANALDRILERKRILRMKPAPKPVDAHEYEERRRRRKSGGDVVDEVIDAPPGMVEASLQPTTAQA